MEIIRDMHVSASTLMNHLVASLHLEIKQHNIDETDLKSGLVYTKMMTNKFGQGGEVKVTIVTLTDEEYTAKFETTQGTNQLSYLIEPIDDHHCRLVYREEFETHQKMSSLNYKLMSTLFNRRNKKRVNALLLNIDNYLVQNQEEANV